MSQNSLKILGYYEILNKLKNCASTDEAKQKIEKLEPILSETELIKNINETSQAKQMIELLGTPPLPIMKNINNYIESTIKGDLLLPDKLEEIGLFLNSVKRLKVYLKKGEEKQISIAFYNENLNMPYNLKEEIERCIHSGMIDNHASSYLNDIRIQIQLLESKINEKVEREIKSNKAYLNDYFVVTRNGIKCIPVRKECKSMVLGTVIDQSASGATLFIEPKSVSNLREELEIYLIEEDAEERRILYSLSNMIAENADILIENTRVIKKLDFIFAKGKLSLEMNGIEPKINLEHYIILKDARHPMLDKEACIPLNFEIGKKTNGIIITGPNTGGKTVTIKTVALMSAMACSGLHVPCSEADICMQNQILCDIGDGQNISDNLSTFSAHIKNILEILKKAGKESLIIIDELGSGTDPTEGMGIAISVLEELRKSGALFLVTTHYPQIKDYAKKHQDLINARMEFDRESLKPLYKLKVGEAGESCALFIARRLGFSYEMLSIAAKEAYGVKSNEILKELKIDEKNNFLRKTSVPHIKRKIEIKQNTKISQEFSRGDSVIVSPNNEIGIVVQPADCNGNVLVQIKKEKILLNHKRLTLKVSASELYPDDYDFSIIFDTVENRKARHKMGKNILKGWK